MNNKSATSSTWTLIKNKLVNSFDYVLHLLSLKSIDTSFFFKHPLLCLLALALFVMNILFNFSMLGLQVFGILCLAYWNFAVALFRLDRSVYDNMKSYRTLLLLMIFIDGSFGLLLQKVIPMYSLIKILVVYLLARNNCGLSPVILKYVLGIVTKVSYLYGKYLTFSENKLSLNTVITTSELQELQELKESQELQVEDEINDVHEVDSEDKSYESDEVSQM